MPLLPLVALAYVLWPAPFAPPAWADDYDVTARPPETLPPGTVIGTAAPDGWSHLVIKSLPRVRPGEEAKVPPLARSLTVRMTRWMFTAFVADVRPVRHGRHTRYHLRAVALGLGTTVNGQDVVVTPQTAKQHGVELDWITRQILDRGYATQSLATIVVHGPTFALMDTPVWFRCGTKNRLVRFRYALLVDAPTGRLDVLVWLLDPEGGCGGTAEAAVLFPDQIDEAELVADPQGFDALGIANEATFGVDRLPAHRAKITLPAGVWQLATRTRFTPEQAHELESGLRQLGLP